MTQDDVKTLARVAGIEIDPRHLPGVTQNLGILLGQAAVLCEHRLAVLVEPAPVFRP